MIEAILAIAGSVLGAWLWWLKNRAKTRLQKSDEEIEKRNEKRKASIDGWVRGVDRNGWWIDRQ
ncbi:MAG: hypothetical protein EBX17_11955 [Betaproteobacteria bacterium]|nr:hypothetical protein [Betaproteobacteria bacterium]